MRSEVIQNSFGHSKVVLPSGIAGTVLLRWDVSIDVHHYTKKKLMFTFSNNYWTFKSYLLCVWNHFGYQKQKYYFDGRTIGMFRVKFNFHFLPDRRTLKFLKMKCNPTNKTKVALRVVQSCQEILRIINSVFDNFSNFYPINYQTVVTDNQFRLKITFTKKSMWSFKNFHYFYTFIWISPCGKTCRRNRFNAEIWNI